MRMIVAGGAAAILGGMAVKMEVVLCPVSVDMRIVPADLVRSVALPDL